MCGRFSQIMTWAEIHALYEMNDPAVSNIEPAYNISPTDPALVIRRDSKGETKLERMRWWLVPFFWKKSLKEVPPAFNARAETIATQSLFKEAFKRRRCIVPASGFYEWSGEKKARLPWYFTSPDGLPLSFAGLYERWKNPETAETVQSCTIITTDANRMIARIHDRMPVILDKPGAKAWLDAPDAALLKPAPEGALRAFRVDPKVNSNRYQEPDAIRPIAGVEELA
jgi:putative SOS response-associated peptidase YedK